jgi:hypothetical protein
MRDLDQPLGDQRPRDRGAQQIQPLVERVRPEHRKDEVAHEFLAHVLDMDVLGPHPQQFRLGARRLQLLALAQIGGEGHHLAAVFGLQPFQDDRGVEPAGIGKHDFLGRDIGGSFQRRTTPASIGFWPARQGRAGRIP